jgi:hypothetical protein
METPTAENPVLTPEGSTSPEVDPILTNDMTDVKPDQPLIPKNDYVLEVVKLEQKRGKDKPDGTPGNSYISVQMKTVEPITSVTGEPLPAGQTYFGRLMITPTDKLTKANIERGLKKFQLCFGVTSGAFFPFDQYVGKRGKVSIGFAKKTDEYPDDRNEVKGFVLPK